MGRVKQKFTFFIGIFWMITCSSYSQDTAYQAKIEAMKNEFSQHYDEISYNNLPDSIRKYLEQLYDENFSRSKELFNASDAGFGAKKERYWIRRSVNDYMLTFDHKGTSRHYHSICFKTNGREIKHVDSWITPKRMKVVEYSNWHLYQDTLLTIMDEFSVNNIRINSYKELPDFIRYFLDHVRHGEFRISKKMYSAGCGGGIKRKLSYILKCDNNYILSYDHGGLGHHFHSVIFKTNGKEITNIYNVLNSTHSKLADLIDMIEYGWYSVQTFDEF